MSTLVAMAHKATGHFALFEQAPGVVSSATCRDPYSDINRPFLDPVNWLQNVLFHSAFRYLAVVASTDGVNVSHPFVAASPDSSLGNEDNPGGSHGFVQQGNINGEATGNHLLLNHGLGIVPRYKVALGTSMLTPGFPVQSSGSWARRYITAYATTTEIRLIEFCNRSAASIPATNQTYKVLVFEDQPTPISEILANWDPTTPVVSLGLERFISNKRFLQVVPGGSPFALSQNETIHGSNGVLRIVTPTLDVFETMPPGTIFDLWGSSWSTTDAIHDYQGAFAGTAGIQVQAP